MKILLRLLTFLVAPISGVIGYFVGFLVTFLTTCFDACAFTPWAIVIITIIWLITLAPLFTVLAVSMKLFLDLSATGTNRTIRGAVILSVPLTLLLILVNGIYQSVSLPRIDMPAITLHIIQPSLFLCSIIAVAIFLGTFALPSSQAVNPVPAPVESA